MSKWFVEVVKDDFTGMYHANMMVDGRVVKGLSRDMEFDALRKGIFEKTGVEIPEESDLTFWKPPFGLYDVYVGYLYSLLDGTRERVDCRVSLAEFQNEEHGWYPDFDGSPDLVGKEVVMGPYLWNVDGFDGIHFEIGMVVEHLPRIDADLCARDGLVAVHFTERLFLDGHSVKLDKNRLYHEGANTLDSGAREVALEKLADIQGDVALLKEMPLAIEPCLNCDDGVFNAFFKAMDVVKFTDKQLMLSDRLAEKYIGAYNATRGLIRDEIVERFCARLRAE